MHPPQLALPLSISRRRTPPALAPALSRQLEKDMKEEKRQAKIEERKRREENLARKAANEMKNTVLQTMTKTHKIKTMNKKQLRQIKKTAINAQTGNLELVSPWKKN